MNGPLISVIVPVYKVEPYLRKCLDTISDQTYRNLEIILVDDGSPDACGAICDEYAANDARIRVIHKANGGVSSARNAGLAAASGEWIGWVDSDDWIEPDMYEYLLDGVARTGADIAVCGWIERGLRQSTRRAFPTEQLLDMQEAIGLLLENGLVQNFLWDKLWRRELFEGLIFPEGRTYEDIVLAYKLFERAKRVVCLTGVKYIYLMHSGSISANTSLSNQFHYYIMMRHRRDDMLSRWSQYRELLEAQCIASAVGLWCGYWRNPKDQRRKYLPLMREIAKDARLHNKSVLRCMNLGATGRMVVRLMPYPNGVAFALALFLSWLYELKHGRPL